MAVEWWEMNLETCSGMKNIPQGQGNTSVKKIRVIRRVEVKMLQKIDEKVEKVLLKKGSLHKTVEGKSFDVIKNHRLVCSTSTFAPKFEKLVKFGVLDKLQF